MPRYAIFVTQQGGGCDYTIGCGMDLIEIGDFDDDDQAQKAARKRIFSEDDPFEDDRELEFATLVTINRPLPVEDWYKERSKELEGEQLKAEREKELAQLAKLKAKYG